MGHIPYELNSKEVINVLKATEQMFLDAYSKQNGNFDELERSIQVSTKDLAKEQDHDLLLDPFLSMLSVPRYSLSFEYEYDVAEKKWKLKSIIQNKNE